MSKVKRFSLEERYGYQNRKVIYDKNDNNDIELNNIYPIIDLLNQLDEQISDLQHRLEVADKALENVCKRLQDYYCTTCDNQTNCSRVEMCEMSLSTYLPSDFKEQAEEEVKGEKL